MWGRKIPGELIPNLASLMNQEFLEHPGVFSELLGILGRDQDVPGVHLAMPFPKKPQPTQQKKAFHLVSGEFRPKSIRNVKVGIEGESVMANVCVRIPPGGG